MSKKILILCTGNSCRSQMAEAVLHSFDPALHVYSAGTHPAYDVHPLTILVMKEIGVEMAEARPKSVDQFLTQEFDYVITVCDHAREACPAFSGKVLNTLHMGFDDPASAYGSEEDVVEEFRRVRDEIRSAFSEFYLKVLKEK